MPVKVTFELSDADLERFRGVLAEARKRVQSQDISVVLAAARRLVIETRQLVLPDFVASRLATVESLAQMVEDEAWSLDGAHRERVLTALAYFAEPNDAVPDTLPGIGFLDDAILVELVVQELRPELDAYAEFRRFRDAQATSGPGETETGRMALLDRRRAMYARMERRRERRGRRGGTFSLLD